MATYATNSDLVLMDGQSVNDLFKGDISEAEIILQKNAARDRAYQEINQSWLKGLTAVPASHIEDQLKYIEIDLCISYLLSSGYTQNKFNESEWVNIYRERAEKSLKQLRIPASADIPSAHSNNTGNGTLTISGLSDQFTEMEFWEIICISSTHFAVYGSKSGKIEDAEIGEYYPAVDRFPGGVSDYGMRDRTGYSREKVLEWVEFPLNFTITQGSTDFAIYDRFTFWTYSSTYKNDNNGVLRRG